MQPAYILQSVLAEKQRTKRDLLLGFALSPFHLAQLGTSPQPVGHTLACLILDDESQHDPGQIGIRRATHYP